MRSLFSVQVSAQAGEWQSLPLEVLDFPGGEMHVRLQPEGVDWLAVQSLQLKAHVRDAQGVMTLLLLADALRRLAPQAPQILHLPYVPYARQDRVTQAGEALSAKVMAQLINAQQFARVHIQDPHSDVIVALLDRVVVDDPLPALREVRRQIAGNAGPVALVCPDAGARKRVHQLARALQLPVVEADKQRDTRSGQITGLRLLSEVPDMPLWVVDDICDGGRTFTELAEVLRGAQQSAGFHQPLYLFVSHGIFSKGLDPLLACYERVFTRHNWTADARCTAL